MNTEVKPGDPIKNRGRRAGILTNGAPVKSNGWTLLKYRTSRVESRVRAGKPASQEILLPASAARAMLVEVQYHRKISKLLIQAIEDFRAFGENPKWMASSKLDPEKRQQDLLTSIYFQSKKLKTFCDK